jgi:hypothetical protein
MSKEGKMPLPKGTRYRYKKGTKIRLAFAKGTNKVIETKNMATGETQMIRRRGRSKSYHAG